MSPGNLSLSAIKINTVDRYEAARIAKGLAPRTVNIQLDGSGLGVCGVVPPEAE